MTAPRMRAGTTDRQATVDHLTRHFTEGRLNPEEFDDRVGKAYAATHLDELPGLLADLPQTRRQDDGGPGQRNGRVATGSAQWVSQRPPPALVGIVAVLGVVAMVFAVAALSPGHFPFPLLWIVLAGLFLTRGHRRRLRGDWRDDTSGRCRAIR
jgi:hypothetical protein